MASSDCWDRVSAVMPHTSRILLHGPPGTGKTSTLYETQCQHGVTRRECSSPECEPLVVQCHEETSVAELAGHFIAAGDRFVWMDGPVLTAWRFGRKLIIDEIDLISGPAMSFMRGVANDRRVARITVPDPALAGLSDEELVKVMLAGKGQQILRPGDGFFVIATMNGDPEVDLDEPLADRFPVKIYIDRPHPDAIAALPADLQECARETSRHTDPQRRIGIRAWKEFASLRTAIGEDMAADAIFAKRSGDVMDALRLARDKQNGAQVAPKVPAHVPTPAPIPAGMSVNPHVPVPVTGTRPRAYSVRSGGRGRPTRARCAIHGELTHKHGELRVDGLYCKSCNVKIAPIGTISFREKVADTGNPKQDWRTYRS